MKSIYRCTILIYILLSQLDLFTLVEGAGGSGATSSRAAMYKQIAIEERDAKAGKPRASPAMPKPGKVSVDPKTGGKTLDISLASFGEDEGEEIEVVEQKRSPRAHAVQATAGAHQAAHTARPKYDVSSEVRKVGAQPEQAAPPAHAPPSPPAHVHSSPPSGTQTNPSKAAFIAELKKLAEDLTSQYNELSAQVQRRQAGAAAPPSVALPPPAAPQHSSAAPQTARPVHVEVLEQRMTPPSQPSPQPHMRPKYVTTVETVRSQPRSARTATGQAHLPTDLQTYAEVSMPSQGLEGGHRTPSAPQYKGDKIDLLHHKVDRIYSEVAVLRHDFTRLNAKFDAFISAASTGGSTSTAARAAAAMESHLSHTAGHQPSSGGEDLITGYQLASQFPSGWHDHSFQRTGISVDFTDLPTQNRPFEVLEQGDVVTCIFNKKSRVDELKCAGTEVWELGYTKNNSTYPIAARYNKKTLKILVNLDVIVLLYERESDGKWKLANDFKLTPIELTVQKLDETTDNYQFTADTSVGKFTYKAKEGKSFKSVKHESAVVWKSDYLMQGANTVEYRVYPVDMFGLTLHFMDRSEMTFVKESVNAQWVFVDPSKVTPATVNVFSTAETFSYTMTVEPNGVKVFKANHGFKFNRVIAKHGSTTCVICQTQNQLNFANVVEFDAMGATRKVILHYGVGSGAGASKKTFEETADGWKAETDPSAQTTPATSTHSPIPSAQTAGSTSAGSHALSGHSPGAGVANLASAVPASTPPASPASNGSHGQSAPLTGSTMTSAQPNPSMSSSTTNPGVSVPSQSSATPAVPSSTPASPAPHTAPTTPASQPNLATTASNESSTSDASSGSSPLASNASS